MRSGETSENRDPYIRLGLTGWPLGHSLSPEIHHAALKQAGLQGRYDKFPIPPQDQAGLAALLARVQKGELDGLNVTIPYKLTVIPFLKGLTPTARAVGAVNTIFRREDGLFGDNTDVPGFLADLARLAPDPGLHALVLGAGGAARAVGYALAREGWRVLLAARREKQAGEVAEALNQLLQAADQAGRPGIPPLQPILLEGPVLEDASSDCGLVVNTTPVGMHPNQDASPWPAGTPLPARAVVYDLVYNPTQTRLVRDARAVGLAAQGGLGMLVEQAALSFERWTGRPANRRAMFAALTRTD